jgi:osomolarity two-component system, sensor histidine kinase SLN1
MRISIRTQLCLLLLTASSIGLVTLGLALWFTNHAFILRVTADNLQTAASLKAAELASSLDLQYTSSLYLTAFGEVQNALKSYNNGSNTGVNNWRSAADDLRAALNNLGALNRTPAYQVQLFPTNVSGPLGTRSVLNVTGPGVTIALPWNNAHGEPAQFGEDVAGYPHMLYPTLSITESHAATSGTYTATFGTFIIGLGSSLILGPLTINDSFSLLSMTMPVVDNYSATNVLGWITVVQSTRLIENVLLDDTGLGATGQTIVVGPVGGLNLFAPSNNTDIGATNVELKFPLGPNATSRHPTRVINSTGVPFSAGAYPAVVSAMRDGFSGTGDLGVLLSTHNEDNVQVSAAYATPPTTLVDWIVIVEKDKSDVWQPIQHGRDILLACTFSVLGFLLLVSFPVAHWAVLPLTKLRAATESAAAPICRTSSHSRDANSQAANEPVTSSSGLAVIFAPITAPYHRWRANRQLARQFGAERDQGEKRFRIPNRVTPSHPWLKDDISDLTKAFNEMSDELLMQYAKLEERVQQRTIELEQSKIAAEAANESKTLFVANVSHELKTPLNGILGMCATCLEENDVQQLRTSMSIIYNSGDLLLRTLNDILTFSSNQVGGQELTLDERMFKLRELETQVIAIFDQNASGKGVKLRVRYEDERPGCSAPDSPSRNTPLWGDIHRILQILLNLISNSLKHTPQGGEITITFRRLAEPAPWRPLLGLDQMSQASRRSRLSARLAAIREEKGTANFINPTEPTVLPERTLAPAGDDIYVEFEVCDTGEGISEDMQRRIFEPFVQVDSGLNRKHSGTGLGLSICLQLASLMRGSIALRSKVGEGSTFTVKLPLRHILRTPSIRTQSTRSRRDSMPLVKTDSARGDGARGDASRVANDHLQRTVSGGTIVDRVDTQEPHTATLPSFTSQGASITQNAAATAEMLTEPAIEERKPGPKVRPTSKQMTRCSSNEFSHIRVLIVEDNRVNQQVIIRMLKLKQITNVTIAEDGQVALDIVKAHMSSSSSDLECPQEEASVTVPFELIFMDIQMPNMDGLTSTRLMRELGLRIPIIALTAFAEKSNVEECFACGMDFFLAKPIKKPKLEEVLLKFCCVAGETYSSGPLRASSTASGS